MTIEYNFQKIERYWQNKWKFKTTINNKKKKYYVLEMFMYPSGNIHMGHLRNYTIGDVIARYKMAQNFNVLHPMGWDAFGLPAENAAIQNNIQPKEWTYSNILIMREQLKTLGCSYDWDRELETCNPNYYKYEQEFFLKFLENGLAYRKESIVNWDTVDNTVLADEQVIDGKGWRSGMPVERKKLYQWFLKTTKYEKELLQELENLKGWPINVKSMQKNWIGKSEGAIINFNLHNRSDKLQLFTTRPETLFGATYCAISTEHPLAIEISKNNKEVEIFINKESQNSQKEELIQTLEKRGIKIDIYAEHPFLTILDNKTPLLIPIYIANFVLMNYGTGAVFACPAHDQRDYDFAKKYNIEIKQVIFSK